MFDNKFIPEKKIWLPKGQEDRTDEKFRSELTRLCEEYRVGAAVVVYVNFNSPTKGKIMILGQPSCKWLDATWQRIRLLSSDLITRNIVK
jgi:hypothetical protein